MPSHEEYNGRVKDLLGFDLLGALGKSGTPSLTRYLRYLSLKGLLTPEMFRTIATILGTAKEVWALLPEAERRAFTDAIWATARDGTEYEGWIFAVSAMTMKNTVTAFLRDPACYSRMDEVKAIVDWEMGLLSLRYDEPSCARLLDSFFSDPDSANRAATQVGIPSLACAFSDLPAGLWAPRLGAVLSANAREEFRALLRDPSGLIGPFRRSLGKDALFHAFFAQRAKPRPPSLREACAALAGLPDADMAECVGAFGPVVLANLLKSDRACLRAAEAGLKRLPPLTRQLVDAVISYDFKIRKIQVESEVSRLSRTVSIQAARRGC